MMKILLLIVTLFLFGSHAQRPWKRSDERAFRENGTAPVSGVERASRKNETPTVSGDEIASHRNATATVSGDERGSHRNNATATVSDSRRNGTATVSGDVKASRKNETATVSGDERASSNNETGTVSGDAIASHENETGDEKASHKNRTHTVLSDDEKASHKNEPVSDDEKASHKNEPATVSEECVKDLLLIVDTSNSVKAFFESDMKPFLKSLVTDRDLHVSQFNGTQVAFMIFSEREKTEVKLAFRKIYDARKLAKFIDDLKWDDVKGGFTRTDLAFEMANEAVFPKNNPVNNRHNADDVVVIITDGNPWGIENILNITIEKANLLKEKGIEIVGAAVGSKSLRNEFKPKLEKMVSSPEHIVEADFKDIDSIRSKLIENTCKKPIRKMCGDKFFFPASQVCCCGSIHNNQTGFECCGPRYYKITDYKCCEFAHLVSIRENCPFSV